MLKHINNERGFISVKLMAFGMIFWIAVVTVFLSFFIAVQTKGTMTYDWFEEALGTATFAANIDGDTSKVASNEPLAMSYFMKFFADMTNCTVSGNTLTPKTNDYPGPIELTEFKTVSPGEYIPNGTAKQPGYLATIQVPVFGGNLPLIGPQYLTIPMKSFQVVKSSDI
ncbi:conserved hypothetical protein [Desulforamulus reducens MI-1]|uniref:Type 4 fimbrial biogenesis protein PilX N-terminal domain-containing protein n=1 Tax=Desulforamulus reducens (strain ATCC BAA-1160 / DSM 100696 / MI-1) TaxID=349161 RepID=A4J323_DESRM|nr:hypothetical protein [Desulforamulus reducens]ABO49476.1 conserved hypothetical protein [Desulforamulus reducens MI-1]